MEQVGDGEEDEDAGSGGWMGGRVVGSVGGWMGGCVREWVGGWVGGLMGWCMVGGLGGGVDSGGLGAGWHALKTGRACK